MADDLSKSRLWMNLMVLFGKWKTLQFAVRFFRFGEMINQASKVSEICRDGVGSGFYTSQVVGGCVKIEMPRNSLLLT